MQIYLCVYVKCDNFPLYQQQLILSYTYFISIFIYWVCGVCSVRSFSLRLCRSFQRTSSPAKTVASGTAARGTCRPTSCTTAPVGRSSRLQPHPPRRTNLRSPTPTNASVPSHSATRAAPAPARWRSTCAPTAVGSASTTTHTHTHTSQLQHSQTNGFFVPPSSGERPFVCLICLSAFTTKANCERHLKVHTDTLNGVCHGCGFVSTTRDILYSHLVTSHMVCQPGSRNEVYSPGPGLPKLPLTSGESPSHRLISKFGGFYT